MFLNYLNFLKFLKYLKDYKCDENPHFQSITQISSDNRGRFLVKSDKLMLNFENIRNNIFSNFDKKHLILSLYFVEFKGSKIGNPSFKSYFEENILTLPDNQCKDYNDSCPINDINKVVLESMFDSYTDIISTNLKLKPFESLFIIFPKICEEYSKNVGVNFSIGEFYSFILTKIRCHLIVVYKSGINHINDEKTFAADLKDKYRVLKNNGVITDFKVYDEIDFKNNLLNDIIEFPFSFLDVIINVVDNTLKCSKDPSEFGFLIEKNLSYELNFSNISISIDQQSMLKRVISKCCMDAISSENNFH